VGEDPGAVDAAGYNVHLVRYLAVIFGGCLVGLAGSYLTLSMNPSWTEGMSSGRGWIVIALTIFALWDPVKALFGGWLFGFTFALTYFVQGYGIPIRFLNMLPYFAPLVIVELRRRRVVRSGHGVRVLATHRTSVTVVWAFSRTNSEISPSCTFPSGLVSPPPSAIRSKEPRSARSTS